MSVCHILYLARTEDTSGLEDHPELLSEGERRLEVQWRQIIIVLISCCANFSTGCIFCFVFEMCGSRLLPLGWHSLFPVVVHDVCRARGRQWRSGNTSTRSAPTKDMRAVECKTATRYSSLLRKLENQVPVTKSVPLSDLVPIPCMLTVIGYLLLI